MIFFAKVKKHTLLVRAVSIGGLLVWTDIALGAAKLNYYGDYGLLAQSGNENMQEKVLSIKSDPFGYSGEYTDSESGLQYLKARYYNPDIMRFLSMDDRFINRYNYAFGNPILFEDPSGHSPVGANHSSSLSNGTIIGIGFGASATIGLIGGIATTFLSPMLGVPALFLNELVGIASGEGTVGIEDLAEHKKFTLKQAGITLGGAALLTGLAEGVGVSLAAQAHLSVDPDWGTIFAKPETVLDQNLDNMIQSARNSGPGGAGALNNSSVKETFQAMSRMAAPEGSLTRADESLMNPLITDTTTGEDAPTPKQVARNALQRLPLKGVQTLYASVDTETQAAMREAVMGVKAGYINDAELDEDGDIGLPIGQACSVGRLEQLLERMPIQSAAM